MSEQKTTATVPWRNAHGEVRIDGHVERLNDLAGRPFFAGDREATEDIYAANAELVELRSAIGDAFEHLDEALLWIDSGGHCADHIRQAMAVLIAPYNGSNGGPT